MNRLTIGLALLLALSAIGALLFAIYRSRMNDEQSMRNSDTGGEL